MCPSTRTPHLRRPFLFVALLSVACSEGLGPHATLFDIDGTWVAVADYDIKGSSLAFDITQHQDTITGTGVWAWEAGPRGTLQVDGVYVWPHVTLHLHYDNGLEDTYRGRVLSSHVLAGVMSDTLGNSFDLAFIRR